MAQAIKSILKFLIPRKTDAPVVCIGLLVLLASVFPDFLKYAVYFSYRPNSSFLSVAVLFTPLSLMLVSLGASFGLFKLADLKSHSWILWLTLFALIFLSVNAYRNSILFFEKPIAEEQHLATLYPQVFMANIAAFFGAWLATACFIRLIDAAKKRFEGSTFGRTSLMIVVAILLFLVLTTFNVMKELGIGTNTGSGRLIRSGGGGVLAIGLVCFFGCAVPAGLINQFRSWRAVPVMVLYFLFAIAVLAVTFSAEESMILVLFYGIVFSAILIAMKSFRNTVSRNQDPQNQISSNVGNRGWSIWGWAVLLLAIVSVALSWNYNLFVLGMTKDFSTAKIIKKFSTSKGADTLLWAESSSRLGPQAVIGGSIHMQDTVSPEYFAPVKTINPKSYVLQCQVSGLNPSINTSYLQPFAKGYGAVQNSTVTVSQLEDLSSQSSNFSIINCEIVEPENDEVPLSTFSTCAQLYLNQSKPGSVARFLRGIDKQKFACPIRFYQWDSKSDLVFSPEDISEILEQSRSSPIRLYKPIESNALANLLADENGRMAPRDLTIEGYEPSSDAFWQLLLDTQINAQLGVSAHLFEPQVYWDAAFSTVCQEWSATWYRNALERAIATKRKFPQIARQFHWAFAPTSIRQNSDLSSSDSSSSESVTGLFLPLKPGSFVEQIGKYRDLETLSFDTRWLPSFGTNFNSDVPHPVDLSEFRNLSKLKRLDLPLDFWTFDLLFLESMPELEQLQVDVFVNASVTNHTFQLRAKNCPSLKRLTLVGVPPLRMLKEIARLPKLESLTIVDPNSTFKGAGVREQFERDLAPLGENFTLTVVDISDHVPDVPKEFVEHIEQVRSAVREKYLGDESN